MARKYRVSPAATGWAVYESGTRLDTKGTKQAAKNLAYRKARRGDMVEIRRKNGTVQEFREVSG